MGTDTFRALFERSNGACGPGRGGDGPLEIAQSTPPFSSGVIRLSLGAGHGGPFEVAACPARCGLSTRRWTRQTDILR